MAGSYQEYNPDVAGCAAEVEASVPAAKAAAAEYQTAAGRFISEHGADVLDGHSDVGNIDMSTIGY